MRQSQGLDVSRAARPQGPPQGTPQGQFPTTGTGTGTQRNPGAVFAGMGRGRAVWLQGALLDIGSADAEVGEEGEEGRATSKSK